MCGRLGDWKGSHPPIGDEVLKVWPASKRVNTPRENSAELLEPVA
jgi:putative SOS response-associated peptidase YedK